MEPRPSHPPLPLDGSERETDVPRHLFFRQSSEEPEVDDLGLTRIEDRKLFERSREIEEIDVPVLARQDGLVEGHSRPPSTALSGAVTASMVDEDPAHRLGCDAEELLSALPTDIVHAQQLEIDLVYQGRGLQGMAAALIEHLVMSDAAELVISELHELRQ